MSWLKHLLLALTLLSAPAIARAETLLVMAEEAGCIWCQRWNAEIGPIYPKTPEGQAAPLIRYDLAGPPPDGMTFTSRLRFTPTFVLVRDGTEVARMEGYPGQDFFWGLLAKMLDDAGLDVAAGG